MENEKLESSEPDLESIEEIIEDELRRVSNPAPLKMSPEAARQTDSSNRISKLIFERIINEPLPYFFIHPDTDLLISLIKRTKLDNFHAHMVFSYIDMMLRDILGKQADDSKDSVRIESAIEALNSTAVYYFESELFEELKEVHIAEILQRAKATLARLNDDGDKKYFRQAIERIKENVELRIELRKEEKLNRELMYEPNSVREDIFDLSRLEEVEDRVRRQRERGLTRENGYLFLHYLIEHASRSENASPTIKARADVAEYLTGYSSTKLKEISAWFEKEKALCKENNEIGEKFLKEMKIIRKHFEKLCLHSIVEQIDRDLEDI